MSHTSDAEALVLETNLQLILNKAYEEFKKTACKENGTFLPLAVTSYHMAELLFLNNYEINMIHEPYLRLWSLEPRNYFIPLPRLIELFPTENRGIVKMFFKESDVMYEDFFIMVCCFVFFNTKHLLLLLLSMSQIFSNIFISRKQVNDFFATYYLDKEKYSDLLKVLKKSAEESNCPDQMYYMKDFLTYFQESPDFNKFLHTYRDFLIDLTMKQDSYEIIKNRMKFFYDHNSIDDLKKLRVPKESCLGRILRKCFTARPAPYHYDYYTLTNCEKAFDDMLYLIRQVFGYSCRKSSFRDDNAKYSMKSDKSERSALSGNRSGFGSFQRFRAKPSRSCGYPAINPQLQSLNNPFSGHAVSTKHKCSSNKHFFPNRNISKNKIAPEEESEKNIE